AYVEEPGEDRPVVEVFSRELPGRLALRRVLAVDPLDALDRLLEVLEGEEAAPGRQHALEPGGLRQHRPTTGEVVRPAVAEPARPRHDLRALHDAELAARAPDVALVLPPIADRAGVGEDPSVVPEDAEP